MTSYTVVYALEEPPASYSKAIYLAGPTPRDIKVASWRPLALQFLREAGYDGVVLVPEDRSGEWHGDWQAQAEWEQRHMAVADCVLFWIPRDMMSLPGLTTNVEFGRLEDSGRIVYGSPPSVPQNRYLQHYAAQLQVPSATSLHETVILAIAMVGEGAVRTGGEREVPLNIWRTPAFQQWYSMLVYAGNRLDHARPVWTFRVGPQRQHLLLWALHVDIYIAAEGRNKSNEVVLARPDISTVVMYRRAPHPDDSYVVLIREFRSTVANDQGYVYESAGGSSFKPGGNPLELAADEVYEEVGISLDPSRFRVHEVRQVVSTLSTHRAHLFSVELTDDELERLLRRSDEPHGVLKDGERTYAEVMTLGGLRPGGYVDWATLGMIMQVLY